MTTDEAGKKNPFPFDPKAKGAPMGKGKKMAGGKGAKAPKMKSK